MKLKIIEKTPTQYVVRKGWSNYSGFKEEYIDFERDIFTIPDSKTGGNIYIQQVVTLHAPKNDGDYTEAYMVTKQNNPDGDHDESDCIKLEIAYAVGLCLEEIK